MIEETLPNEAAGAAEDIGFGEFASAVFSYVRHTPFHDAYYRILEHFARGDIRKLIVTVPPQHGKSEYVRTSTQTEVIGRTGELYSVGREGSLTGNEVDVFILDDLYK